MVFRFRGGDNSDFSSGRLSRLFFWRRNVEKPVPTNSSSVLTINNNDIDSVIVPATARYNTGFAIKDITITSNSGGTQSFFLTEHLAGEGFTVVASDYPDDANLCNTKGGAKSSVFQGLRALRNLLKRSLH